MKKSVLILGVCLMSILQTSAQCVPNFFIYRHTAECLPNGTPQINFIQEQWVGHDIFRREPGETAWSTTPLVDNYWGNPTSIGGSMLSNFYVPANHPPGKVYEYRFTREIAGTGTFSGYIMAGCNVPAKVYRGKVLLVVSKLMADSLSPELEIARQDLLSDGYEVERIDILPQSTVPEVKAAIQLITSSWSPEGERYIYLIGNIPVPYSGLMMNDDVLAHRGAWPSDVYYAEHDMTWTDALINNTEAARPENHNIPGDGKFDQNLLTSAPDFALGRVDLSNLPCYTGISEVGLMRRYFQKNHSFRQSEVPITREGYTISLLNFVLNPNPQENGFTEYYGKIGDNNFPAISDSLFQQYGWVGTFAPDVSSASYRLGFYTGQSGYTYITNIATAGNMNSLQNYNVVFNWAFGQYFGDWDNICNFSRMLIGAKGTSLTQIWSGNPSHYYHMFGMDHTIGQTLKINQWNTNSNYHNLPLPSMDNYYQRTHIALMGDPTLRLHYELPVTGLEYSLGNTGEVELNWVMPQGYDSALVYRASAVGEPLEYLTTVGGNSFTDVSAPSGNLQYCIRTQKLHKTGSGSYYNLSSGRTIDVTNQSGLLFQQSAVSAICLSSEQFDVQFDFSPSLNGTPATLEIRRNSSVVDVINFDLSASITIAAQDYNLQAGDSIRLRTTLADFPQLIDQNVLVIQEPINVNFSVAIMNNEWVATADVPENEASFNWQLNGNPLGNGASVSFPLSVQAQTLQLIAENSCGVQQSEQVLDGTVGLSAVEGKAYRVFPNPASNQIQIATAYGSSPIQGVQIYSMQGQLVEACLFENESISLRHLSPAVYMVCITNTTGQRYFERLVITP